MKMLTISQQDEAMQHLASIHAALLYADKEDRKKQQNMFTNFVK